jgi:hypothetical protein
MRLEQLPPEESRVDFQIPNIFAGMSCFPLGVVFASLYVDE